MKPAKLFLRKALPVVLTVLCFQSMAQDSLKWRKTFVWTASATISTGGMVGLYQLWYKDYPMSGFHFFDDHQEWLQMDKLGHFYSGYYEGRGVMEMLKWAGYSQRQSAWMGAGYGWLLQSTIEVFDGFSDGWGASWADITANTVGSGLLVTQEMLWKEQRILPKFSFHRSPYSAYRPEVLGNSFAERLLKDYNGQIYWLSVAPSAFTSNPEPKFSNAFAIALGYSGDGMTGGFTNPTKAGIPTPVRAREFFIAPDLDLTRIPVKKKWLKSTLLVLNIFKAPLPGLVLKQNAPPALRWITY